MAVGIVIVTPHIPKNSNAQPAMDSINVSMFSSAYIHSHNKVRPKQSYIL